MTSPRVTSRLVSTLATIGIAVACGGQSLNHDGTGGTDSAGGDSGSGGSSGKGGAPGTGGSSSGSGGSPGAGGSPGSGGSGGGAGRGGTGTGASGGSSGSAGRGGAGAGGTSGSAGIGGTGALAGQGGATGDICSLPLESGPCEAAFTRYGFNTKTERCEAFTYGGCEGNENNFESLAACTMSCGPANEGGCPAMMPSSGSACTAPAHPCDYTGGNNCLCEPQSQSACVQLSPNCGIALDVAPPPSGAAGACSEPGCIEGVVIISYYTCSCDSTWTCVVGGQSGGPR